MEFKKWTYFASEKTRSEWQADWEQPGVAQPARIAFRFSQLPAIQEPGPGDWFQGMIAVNLPEGETFDLELAWDENGMVRKHVMKELVCPPGHEERESSK